jgi:hypothetical protein
VSDEPPVAGAPFFVQEVEAGEVEIPYPPSGKKLILCVTTTEGATVYVADSETGTALPAGSAAHYEPREWQYIGKVRVEGAAQIVVEEAE